MLKQRDELKIQDINECIRRIELFTFSMDYKKFMEDIKTQDAVVRNLEIIGEAVKNLSDEFKNKNPKINWNDIARLRDKLIHHYFGVNFDVVWIIIQTDIPKIKYELSLI
jgi:uncharacterized protein with HEPN domain